MTTSTRIIQAIWSALVLGSLAIPARADVADQPLPRYRLRVGQELKYQGTSEFKYQGGAHGYKTDWQAWVIRQNEDGSWRIVLRSSQKFSQSRDGGQRSEQPARVTMAYCDIFPDGRIVPNDSLGFNLDPTSILPRLPEDEPQAKQGWKGGSLRDDSQTDYNAERSEDPDTAVFVGVPHSPMDKVYLSSSQSRYSFDRKRGMVRRVESENAQGYGFKGKGTGATELAAVEQHDADWTRTFAEESNRYFEADRAYKKLLTEASKDSEHVDALLTRAETTLKDAREKISLPILRVRVDEQLASHEGMSSYYTEAAENRAEVLGDAAADWETKDLEGKPHSLKDYRGKVVILDFWYRGCGWCIRAMPQMIQIADDFKGEPVAVLGMNTDRDEKDAQFVVDLMKLNYPVLKAEGLPQKYHVRGFPTLIVIDQEGKVADIHVGYSPTLHEEVSHSIKSLLGKR